MKGHNVLEDTFGVGVSFGVFACTIIALLLCVCLFVPCGRLLGYTTNFATRKNHIIII